jgi:hypothetical protein
MRWGPAFIWISVAALVAAVFTELLGWHAVRTGILIAWVALVLLVAMTRGMRWTSFLTFLSAAALLGAVISELLLGVMFGSGYADTASLYGFTTARGWLLLAWTVLLLPVAIGLASHPMRAPSWGVFAGFWGVVGALWLIVLQVLSVAGLLGGDAYGQWAAWPLALVGIWILVASALGFGAERFPRWVDALGLLAGGGLIAISVSTWIDSSSVVRAAGQFAAIAYVLWAVGLGWVFWGTQNVSRRFRGLAAEHAV